VSVSTNGGENFSSPTGGSDISDDSTTASVRPQIAISGINIVVVVWLENAKEVYAAIKVLTTVRTLVSP
jgi:hypothetical protein